MKREIKLGVIGYGYWGPKIVRNFMDMTNAGVRVVAVADTDVVRRQKVAERYSTLEAVDDAQWIIKREDIDAVIVATPSSTHYQFAKAALLANKHVLVEKPLATDLDHALELASLAGRTRKTLMVGHTYEYSASIRHMRELVASGDLGQIKYVRSVRVNLGPRRLDTNAIWDLAPHDISILLYVLGAAPYAVRAFASAHVDGPNQDVGQLALYFNGTVAYITVSWLDPKKVREMTIVGDKKSLVYDDMSANEKLQIYDNFVGELEFGDNFGEFPYAYRYGRIVKPYIQEFEPLHAECVHFIECVRAESTATSNALAAVAVTRILCAATRSLEKDGMLINIGF